MEEFGTYSHQIIDLKAGVEKEVRASNGSSFVLQEGAGVIQCEVKGKSFKLREAQVNDHRNDYFESISLLSDIDQIIDIRFGHDGLLVGPPQKDLLTVQGQLSTALDPVDLQDLAERIAKEETAGSVDEVPHATMTTGQNLTIQTAYAKGIVKSTTIQRVDNNTDSVLIGADPSAGKGILFKAGAAITYSGGPALKIYNTSAANITYSIQRELF
jgi:hypothetical protein